MPDAFAHLLGRLLAEGHAARSQFSTRSLKELRSLLDAGVLVQERSGGGLVLRVKQPGVLQAFYDARYPGTSVVGPPRASAVGTLRNARKTRRTDMEPVLLRAMNQIVCRREDDDVDLLNATRLTGAACLVLQPGRFWSLAGDIAIVENLECFLHFEDLGIPADVALYASGRLSGLVLQWLGSEALAQSRFVHCGDYDPVGLDEFLRVKAVVGARARLHLPANLKALVAKYGRHELLRDSTAVLNRLRGTSDESVLEVVNILQETGCGLEQEALLLATPSIP